MTWSVSTSEPVRKGGPLGIPSMTNVDRETNTQFEAAVEAATALSRVVGAEQGSVHVSLSGHARPHDEDEGDRRRNAETVTVTVTAVYPLEDAKDEAEAQADKAKSTRSAGKASTSKASSSRKS